MLPRSIQDEILEYLETNKFPLSKIIPDIIRTNKDRRDIVYGLNRRYKLEAASDWQWKDARKADGIPIKARTVQDTANPNVRTHVAFDHDIATKKAGYAASDITTVFSEDIPQKVKEVYNDLKKRENAAELYSNMMETCAYQGAAFLMPFIDKKAELHITQPESWETIVIYDVATGTPEYALRYMLMEESLIDKYSRTAIEQIYHCEWYDGLYMTEFRGGINDSEFSVISEPLPHLFGTGERPGIPIVEFPNNRERISNVELTVDLQDAYDLALSDLSNEVAKSALSFLILKMLGQQIDDDFKQRMTEMRAILIDTPEGDAKFESRTIPHEAVKHLQETLRQCIYKYSFSVDPEYANGNTTAYEVQQQYNGLESDSHKTINNWITAFNYFDELIKTYLITAKGLPDYDTAGISRIFNRTIPKNEVEILVQAQQAGARIANEIKVEKLGLKIDSERNAELLAEEQNMDVEEIGV